MKMPNFRLHQTQATTAMLVGVMGLLSLAALAAVVLKNFNRDTWTILYNEESGWGQYRKPLTYIFSLTTILVGAVALALGFNSLGQKRNEKQGRSWLGMTLGAIAIALAPVLLTLWLQRNEAIIVKAGQ